MRCDRSISTFLNLPGLCTRCAGFTSVVQKNELDVAAGAVVGTAAGIAAATAAGAATGG